MNKTALICFLAILAGLTKSAGQVTNVSVSISSGWNLLANPLDTGATNGANEIMSPIDGEVIMTWNGSDFSWVTYDSGAGGWIDPDLNHVSPPSLPPGEGFAFFNPGTSTTLNFTGRIVPAPGSTNYLALPSGYSLLGSPLAASVTNLTSAPVSLPIIDGMQMLTWNGSDYVYSSYDSGLGGWIDGDFNPQAPPSYSIGQGFFLYNPGPPTNWVQSSP